MNHPAPQPAQADAPSGVEMIVMVILILWLATMPSNQTKPRRPNRPDHSISSRLNSQLDSWMHSGLHGTPVGAVYRYLHACIVEPE